MVKIQLATGYLDVKDGTAFPLNFQVGDIRDVSQRKGNFSKTITLIGSKNNANLLNQYYDINIVAGTFDINKLTLCSVIQDGIPIVEDASMQLTAIKKLQITDGHEEQVDYEVLIKDSRADFFTAIANKELTDISFSDFNHTYDAFNVVNRFSNTIVNGFKYFLPGSGDAVYSTQEFKPAIFAKVYFDRIFNGAGFTYDWPTLSVYDRFDQLIIPYNGGVDNFDYNDYLVKAEKIAPTTVNSNNDTAGFTNIGTSLNTNVNAPATKVNITNFTELDDIQNIFNPITGVYSAPFNISSNNGQSYDYNVTFTYSLNLVNTSGVTLFSRTAPILAPFPCFYRPQLAVNVAGGTLVFSNLHTNTSAPANSSVVNAVASPLSIGVGTTNILTQTISTTLPLSQVLISVGDLSTMGVNVIQVPFTTPTQSLVSSWATAVSSPTNIGAGLVRIEMVISNIQLTILPSSNVVAIGGTLEMNDYVPKKVKQSDFIKAIFNMYNLYAEVDKDQPNKLNLQSRDDYYDAGNEVDWTYKLAKDKEQDLSFLPELTSKKVILTYSQDKDNPNVVYNDATSNIYGQAEVVFNNEYVKDVTTKAILFSPTPVTKTIFGAFVPMIAGAAPQTNLRILYDKTIAGQPLATCGQFYIYDYGSVGQINLTSYPLVGHFDDPLTPTFDINFAVCSFYYYQPTTLTQNNLYNRYWRRTMGQINNGKMLTAMFDLKEPDIQSLKLNDKIRIDNSWWNINKVIDYDANAHKLTKVELISIDSEVNFTTFMGPTGPITPSTPPTPPPAIGPITMLAMSNVNTTRMITSNVFSNNATAMVMGRGNVIVGGTRSMIVGDGNTVGADEMITPTLQVTSINGSVASSVLLPSFVHTDATDVTLWNNGQGAVATNTSYGDGALRSNTVGNSNTANGVDALRNNTIGFNNTAVGRGALITNTGGSGNTAVGISALNANTIGGSNTAVGVNAISNNINGTNNTAMGVSALQGNSSGVNNTAVGHGAITTNTTGSNNTAVGISTDSGNFDASIILGRDATATASNQFVSGSVAYPAGAVNPALATSTQTWDVIINGVPQKILLA